jgi:hypothetical protein
MLSGWEQLIIVATKLIAERDASERAQIDCLPLLLDRALVAQGIEHRSPKAGVAGSNPAEGTDKMYD